MLKTIDILLGVSVVMLIMSMAVTVLTQSVLGLLQSRGRNLLSGISDLLQQIDPGMQRAVVERIAAAVLTHPMVTGSSRRLGTTIHREELTKLLMDISAGNAPADLLGKLGGDARDLLAASLKKNGIENPAGLLDNVRSLALHLEMAHPELASHERQAMALMREAQSQFVAKVNSWFDQTIDRVTERFTRSTQIITTAIAAVVAFTLQLDTIGLINRLSTDDAFRQKMVTKAVELANPPAANASINGEATTGAAESTKTGTAMDATTSTTTDTPTSTAAGVRLTPEQRAEIDSLVSDNILRIPNGYSQWQARWADVTVPMVNVKILGRGAPCSSKETTCIADPASTQRNGDQASRPGKSSILGNDFASTDTVSFLGVLLSALLLSLGAPFWYNTLKNLVRLRSVVAGKDDAQRALRQSSQAEASAAGRAPAAASALVGEKGIVN